MPSPLQKPWRPWPSVYPRWASSPFASSRGTCRRASRSSCTFSRSSNSANWATSNPARVQHLATCKSSGSTRPRESTLEVLTAMRDELSLEQKLEAMLTVALEPISAEELADVVDVDADAVTTTLRRLRAEFLEERRGFQLAELASGWVLQSSPDVAPW